MFNVPPTAQGRKVAGSFQHVQMFSTPVLTFPLELFQGSITKPGNRFSGKIIYFSDMVRRSMNALTFPAICRALASWTIEKPSANFIRLTIFRGDQEVPAIISWQELGRLGDHLKVELGELLRFGLLVKNARLEPRQPKGLPTNRQIRSAIYNFQIGKTDMLPPTLFADIDQKTGRVIITEAPDGTKAFLRVADPDILPLHSIAEIRFEARDKIIFRLLRRDVGRFRVGIWKRVARPATPGSPRPERL